MQQPERLRALHGGDGVLPDAHLGVVDEADPLERADDVAPEVADSDDAVPLLRHWQVHAMDACAAPWHEHAVKLGDEVLEVMPELVIRLAVAHVARAVAVGVQARERRREDREAHALVRYLGHALDAVPEQHLPPVALGVGIGAVRHVVVALPGELRLGLLGHGLDHAPLGVLHHPLLLLDCRHDAALALGGEHEHVDGARLAESPAAPDGLVELLVAVREPAESHLVASLPVHAEAADGRLGDDDAVFAAGEPEHGVGLVLRRVAAAHLDRVRNRRSEGARLVVQLAPHAPLARRAVYLLGDRLDLRGQRLAPRAAHVLDALGGNLEQPPVFRRQRRRHGHVDGLDPQLGKVVSAGLVSDVLGPGQHDRPRCHPSVEVGLRVTLEPPLRRVAAVVREERREHLGSAQASRCSRARMGRRGGRPSAPSSSWSRGT